MHPLQVKVCNAVAERGYLNKPTLTLFKDNTLKAVEEFGEVLGFVNGRETPPAYELADVVIPCLVMARLAQHDILPEIELKTKGVEVEKKRRGQFVRRQIDLCIAALGNLARAAFDNRPPSKVALVLVCTPIFSIALAYGIDLLAEIEKKAQKDINRGVRA